MCCEVNNIKSKKFCQACNFFGDTNPEKTQYLQGLEHF